MKSLEILAEKTAEAVTDLNSLEKFDVSSLNKSERSEFYGKLGDIYIHKFSDGVCSAKKEQLENYVALGCAALLKTENPREYGSLFNFVVEHASSFLYADYTDHKAIPNLNALLSTIYAYDYRVRSKEPDDFFAAGKVLEGAASYFEKYNDSKSRPKFLKQIVEDTHNYVHNYFGPKIRKDEYYIHWDSKFNISKKPSEQFTSIATVYSNELYLSEVNDYFKKFESDAKEGLRACCYLLLHEINYMKPKERKENFEQIVDWLKQSGINNYKDLHSNFSEEWLLVIEDKIKREFKAVFNERWLEHDPTENEKDKYRIYEKLKPYVPKEMKKLETKKSIADGASKFFDKLGKIADALPTDHPFRWTAVNSLLGGYTVANLLDLFVFREYYGTEDPGFACCTSWLLSLGILAFYDFYDWFKKD